jgi:hypothetical protein
MLEIVKIQDLYFLRTNFKLRIPDLIKRIKRQNGMKEDSFAEKYVIKILTDLLSGAIDLSEKYRRYYSEEYESFEDFLYKKELFEPEDIRKLELGIDDYLWMLRFTTNSYSVKSILGYEDENLPIINQTLEYINYEN